MIKNEEYYEALDKRTNEYKEWKKSQTIEPHKEAEQPSEGLGDTLEKVFKATKIDRLVKFIAGEDCGCDERKELMNKAFPFNKVNCLTEDEFDFLTEFSKTKKYRVTFNERVRLYDIHNRVFGTKLKQSSCPSCIKNIMTKLDVILKSYK